MRRCTRLLWDPKIYFDLCRVGNLLNHSSLIWSKSLILMSHCERFAQNAPDKWAAVSESLRSLMTKEQPWANRSGRSWQKSDREQFAQVDHVKRANEGIVIFFSKLFISIFAHKKQAICQKNLKKIIFLIVFKKCFISLVFLN